MPTTEYLDNESREGPVITCVSSSPLSGAVVRRAHRLAERLGRDCRAVYVETPASHGRSETDRHRALEHLRIADHLGAETEILQGRSVADALADEADATDASILVVGKPTRRRWRDYLGQSLIDRLARSTDEVELLLVSGSAGETTEEKSPSRTTAPEELLAATTSSWSICWA
ncbi:MAG: universal stress protein [Bradymonadaceae bacterium]